MFYADTEAGRNSEPTPGATGTCALCSGPVLAKCGQVNTWHWAHRADKDCDPWTEPLTDWHRAYQRVVPAERCEVVFGKHRADVVAATGQVLELQHSTIPLRTSPGARPITAVAWCGCSMLGGPTRHNG